MIVKSWEKEIYQVQLDNEKFVLARLKKAYKESIQEAKEKVAYLATKKQTQSVIYQKQYQESLVKQLETVYNKMCKNMYQDIDSYLKDCYEDGFLSTMYGLHKQGIPLIFPIQQEEAARMAGRTGDGVKLSDKLYQNAGKTARAARDVITRGLASGTSYADIARNLERTSETTLNQAYRIARTEGHRVQNEVNFNTLRKAKDSGADVVKQWDSTLDGRTRPHHAQLDGQIREIDEPFEVAGRSVQYPGGFGVAAEDINCRCAVLQRAKWALDEDELQTLKDRAAFYGLDKSKDFADFKKKYKIADKKAKKLALIKIDNLKQYFGETHSLKIQEILQKAPKSVQNIWNKYVTKLGVTSTTSKGTAYYSPMDQGITINLNDVTKDKSFVFVASRGIEPYRKAYGTIFHEFGHNISDLIAKDLGYTWSDAAVTYKSKKYAGHTLNSMLKEEAKDYVNQVWKDLKDEAKKQGLKASSVRKYEAYAKITKEIRNLPVIAGGDISDMWEGATKASVRGFMGHGKTYWNYHEPGVEAFAEMFDATVNNPDSLAAIKTYFPKTYEIFLEILEGMS